jgi:hypothetical protein
MFPDLVGFGGEYWVKRHSFCKDNLYLAASTILYE